MAGRLAQNPLDHNPLHGPAGLAPADRKAEPHAPVKLTR